MRRLCTLLVAVVCATTLVPPTIAQSTFGTILGTARDSSGAFVSGAQVTITNVDEGTTRTVLTDSQGNYAAPDVKPAHYQVEVAKAGFRNDVINDLQLVARQQLRVDATLAPGQVNENVVVDAKGAGVIATDTAAISASFSPAEVLNLPGNFRASGSTSPFVLISALPGVQPDTGGAGNVRFSIQGGLPSQSESTVDGISTQDYTGNQPLSDAFPSAESIAELRVDGVGNLPEFGTPGEITTVTKSGTNHLHGALFWYHQNRALDAVPYGTLVKPQKIANDYGVTGGGPVVLPFYNGRDKTFFFGTFEGFRFPRGRQIVDTVPTVLEQSGNFGDYVDGNGQLIPIIDPSTGVPFPNNVIPADRISSVSQAFLKFFPAPNAGDTNHPHANNWKVNKSNSYVSNQFDTRLDHAFSQKMQVFGRFTWKNITQDAPQDYLVPTGTNGNNYKIFVFSHNYVFTPNLLNEFRTGFTWWTNTNANPTNGRAFTSSLGLANIGPSFPFNGLPEIDFNNLTSFSPDRLNSTNKSRLFQYNDNLSWTRGQHTMKFGFDVRKIEAVSPLGFFGADNYGTFGFTGAFSNSEFADFLLGVPQASELDQVKSDNDGATIHYAFFAQDSWKASPRLTLEYGLRYELHPGYHDNNGNIGNFDPSVPLSGRVIYPTGKENLLAQGYLASGDACPAAPANGAPCTPVVSAKQAGLPESLRKYPHLRFLPRFGFAYRLSGDGKTVVRGGFGDYNVAVLGSIFYALTGTVQSDTHEYINVDANGKPIFSFPQTSPGGSGITGGGLGTNYFGTANQIDFKDPYSLQWSLSVERELNASTGLRVSYIGMKTDDLVWSPNYNDLHYSTVIATSRPRSDFPFPNWGVLNTRQSGAQASYNSAQVEAQRRLARGLSFDSTYTFSKNLADNQGPQTTSFASENSGSRADYFYDRHTDFGNVYGTRHHRWNTTAVFDLPVGRGRQFGSGMNRLLDTAIGGWSASSIFLWQSGPYINPIFSGGDPSGTGSGSISGRKQRPDVIGSSRPHGQGRNNWLNSRAYTCPGDSFWQPGTNCVTGTSTPDANDPSQTAIAPIGRFGDTSVGSAVGPGTVNLSAGLFKSFSITEGIKLRAEGTFTNVLNHTNLDDPVLNISQSNFGQITDARQSDFGGSRTGQVSMRLEF